MGRHGQVGEFLVAHETRWANDYDRTLGQLFMASHMTNPEANMGLLDIRWGSRVLP